MVVADPAAELLALVRSFGDPAPCRATPDPQRRAELIRRRFGLALPAPFVRVPAGDVPVRAATAADGPAIAAVKWRAFGTNYRGVFPDAFLDERDIVPPAAYWIGRAMVPPSRRHRLLVWGPPGAVFGYVDAGPAEGGAGPSSVVGEIFELYIDPCAQRRGGGRDLLTQAERFLFDEAGFETLELSAVSTNHSAHAFYRQAGWQETGEHIDVDLGVVAFTETRFARSAANFSSDTGPATAPDGGFWARFDR